MIKRFLQACSRAFFFKTLLPGMVWVLLLWPPSASAEKGMPTILILNSYHQGYVWSDNEIAGIRTRLQEAYPELEPPIEHMDAKRFPGPDQIRRFTNRSTLPATIDIRQKIDPDCGMVMADPTHIHQVIMNLITNAYHAMENGGLLTIRLNEAEFTPDRPDSKQAAGPYVRLSVEDTGIGMDPATREKIFDPYFSTKEKDKGTGLGLSVVHGIIKNYRGHISVHSAPDRGSVFEVWIPRAAAIPGGKREVNTAPLPKGTEHILLVDDEATIARMEKQMLERLGYEVTIRTGSIEALAAFQADPEKFDLVITDMTMPGMTGDRLAVEMMNRRPNLPVILCTGFSEQISPEKAASLGIGGFIMKPVVQSELAALIRNVLDKNGCLCSTGSKR